MELAALVSQFGPWVGLAIYGVVAYLKDRARHEDALSSAHRAHADDLRGAIAEGRATGQLMAEVAAELRELRKEVRRIGDAESDPPPEPAPASHRGGRGR